MDCDICGKKATVHLTQLVGGQIKKIALCDTCAADKGVTDPTGFALADMLLPSATTGAGAKTIGLVQPPPVLARRCDQCGFTLEDLKRIRRFGCGHCYTVFRDEVNSMLRGMHKGVRHCGKVPAGLMEMYERTQRLEELRGRLDVAIASENYEEAAGLRDEIRHIEVKP